MINRSSRLILHSSTATALRSFPWVGVGVGAIPFHSSSSSSAISQHHQQKYSRLFSSTGTTRDVNTDGIAKNNDQNDILDFNELPADFPYRKEALIALKASRRASLVARQIQPHFNPADADKKESGDESSSSITTVSKADLSPVTVGDFSVQAMILHDLNQSFTGESNSNDDEFEYIYIAEESSKALKEDENLLKLILGYTGIGKDMDGDNGELLMDCIDLGQSYNTKDGSLLSSFITTSSSSSTSQNTKTRRRRWCLDPIDGTKGFLRGKKNGGQYCIALAMISEEDEDEGNPILGVLSCPNLPLGDIEQYDYTSQDENDERGSIFVATKGGGCYQLPLKEPLSFSSSSSYTGKRVYVTPNKKLDNNNEESGRKISQARFCLGVEKGFGDPLGQSDAIRNILSSSSENIEEENIVRIDSQAKHGLIARGDAEIYLRFPKSTYVEWIWDVACGKIIIEEAGGKVTDALGNELNFIAGGAKLLPPPNSSTSNNGRYEGIVGTNGGDFHKAVLDAYLTQKMERESD